MLAVIQQTWAVPYCVRSPCSPLCKHPPCTPSWLYSDREQEVISYPTSASAFLSQVVDVPGSRPPKPREGGVKERRVQPWRDEVRLDSGLDWYRQNTLAPQFNILLSSRLGINWFGPADWSAHNLKSISAGAPRSSISHRNDLNLQSNN